MLKNVEDKKIAYLIGYLAGDGNFNGGYGKRSDRLGITTTDMDVVRWIDENICKFSARGGSMNDNPDRGIYAKLPSFSLTFGVKYTETFRHYGIMCKKKDRMLQNISKKYMKYFLLGFLDSDGCISFTERKDRNRITGHVSWTHPSIKLLEKIQTYLAEELSIISTIRPKRDEDCFVLSFSKMQDIKRFGEWIYSEKKDVVLKRKYNKFFSLKKELDERTASGLMYPKEFISSVAYGELIGSYSKYMFIDPKGKEHPSTKSASSEWGLEKKVIHRRARQGDCGWSRRCKTSQELDDFRKYTDKLIKKAFFSWLETNDK